MRCVKAASTEEINTRYVFVVIDGQVSVRAALAYSSRAHHRVWTQQLFDKYLLILLPQTQA